jgi:hypothetical protein
MQLISFFRASLAYYMGYDIRPLVTLDEKHLS